MPSDAHRYLVTGGAGFIGRRVVGNLLSLPKTHVAVIDNLSVGLPMLQARQGLECHKIDIRAVDEMRRVVSSFAPDTIIHLAAVHHIPTCEVQRAYSLEVNVVGTEQMLALAQDLDVSRFVLASSGAVYAWCDGALDESAPLAASDNYSLAKLTNETQLAFWADRTGKQGVIARIFNTIGHDDPNAHLIPDIVSQIPEGAQRIEIALGNLTSRRDYIHADDTARGIAAIAAARPSGRLEAFNVSSGREMSVADLVRLLGEVKGVTIDIREDPSRKRRVDRPSQLGSTVKIRTVLGFEPHRTLREALSDIVRHSGRSGGSQE